MRAWIEGEEMKPSKKLFTIALVALAGILILVGVLSMIDRALIPAVIVKDLSNGVVIAAIGIMIWNRKVVGDEKKAAAERKRQEDEAAAAKSVDAEDPADADGSGTDAPH
jgi:cytoskeletal protein RodZ